MGNISVSLEEDLIQIIEEILRKDKTKRSRSAIISESLREYVLSHYPHLLPQDNNTLGPSILSQLKSKRKLGKRLSFRFKRKLKINIAPWTIVE